MPSAVSDGESEDVMQLGVTRGFNCVLFAYLTLSQVLAYFVEPQVTTPFDAFYERSPAGAAIAAVVSIAILTLGGASLIRTFWARFVSSIFDVRSISWDEALALFLMSAMLQA